MPTIAPHGESDWMRIVCRTIKLTGQQKPEKEVSYEKEVCGFCWYGPALCWVARVRVVQAVSCGKSP